MFLSTVLKSVPVLLPVLFVMLLGFCAGRAKEFDRDQLDGFTELVLEYALPAMLFVGMVTTPRSVLLNAAPFLIALSMSFFGLYIVCMAIAVVVLHRPVENAALQALAITFANFAFIGPPIFSSVFGSSGSISVATTGLVVYLTIVPFTVVILEYAKKRTAQSRSSSLGSVAAQAVIGSVKRPLVWSPLLATALVLMNESAPQTVDSMLAQIGSATAGVGLFASGLIIAATRAKVTAESVGNSFVKMIVQPALMALLVAMLDVGKPLGVQGIVMCSLPTGAVPVMLALSYRTYENEAASTMLLSTVAMVVITPIAIAWA